MKKTYSKEYKIKACELVVEDGIKAKVVAEKLGINVVMLYRWISEYETDGAEAFVGKGPKTTKPSLAAKPHLSRLQKSKAHLANSPLAPLPYSLFTLFCPFRAEKVR